MTIRRLFPILLLAGIPAWAQTDETGSMRDPRAANAQGTGVGVFQPWLAVNGSYDTYLDTPVGYQGSIRRSLSLNGGLSAAKAFHRTYVVLGYSGSGTDYIGRAAGISEGWRSSNVVNL